jgi:hypothetical protein
LVAVALFLILLLLLEEVQVLFPLDIDEVVEVVLRLLIGLHENEAAISELQVVQELAAGEHAFDVLELGDPSVFWHLVGVLEALPRNYRATAGEHMADEVVCGARWQPRNADFARKLL